MSSSVFVSLAWLLSMLACVGHLRERRYGAVDIAAVAIPFALVVALADLVSLQPESASFLAALTAISRLINRRSARIGLVLGGACAGMAAILYAQHGVALWIAVALPLAVLAVRMVLVPDSGTGRSALPNAALLVVAVTGVVLGLVPDLLSGWQAAGVLNRSIVAPGTGIPVWTISFAAAAFVLGVIRGMWVNR